MALVPSLDAAGQDRGIHLQKAGPAMLPRKTVERQSAYDIRHWSIGNGGKERLDFRFRVPAEISAKFQVSQPRMERMVPE